MQKNPALGQWTEEETNWSPKDSELIANLLKETPVRTSYQELLAEYEAKLIQ